MKNLRLVAEGETGNTVQRALQAVRSHLGMDVAYVSEFVDGRSVFREVDAPGLEALASVGDSHSLDDVYCRHILAGRLPELMQDTAAEPIAAAMPITAAIPIGCHMSVPVRLPDGSAYGMFCCLSSKPDYSLNDRDLQMMRAFADMAAFEINRDLAGKREEQDKADRIRQVIGGSQLSIVYQPIRTTDTGQPVGLECLSRFPATPPRTPDVWFSEAADAGLGLPLEIAAIRMALSALPELPPELYLAINASPDTVLSSELATTLDGLPGARVVLEITEHAHVDDYDRLLAALRPLRKRGVRIAVDDAGSGYSSLKHILNLRPDLIKLDMTLTRDIDADPVRRALASALISFARETKSRIIAEGVETAAELDALRGLGVEMAQGYYLGRPARLGDILKTLCPLEEPGLKVA